MVVGTVVNLVFVGPSDQLKLMQSKLSGNLKPLNAAKVLRSSAKLVSADRLELEFEWLWPNAVANELDYAKNVRETIVSGRFRGVTLLRI